MVKQCLSSRYMLKCGAQAGFVPEKSGALRLREGEASAFFVSRIYDSGENQTQWGRAVLQISKNLMLQVCVWLFDDKEEGIAADRIEDISERFLYVQARAQYFSNYRELLLYGERQGRGRFARLAAEVFSGEGDGFFTGYALDFPKESFTRYLPELYQSSGQLERFLAVQQSIYLELEGKIDALAQELDYEFCGKKQAERLLKWMGWGELAGELEEDTARELLRTGISLSGRKGTCGYYKKMTEILTGKRTVLIEEPEKCRAVVLILEPPENGRERYLEWLRRNAPLCIDVSFVVLKPEKRLDKNCFLDVNSFLSEYDSELSEQGIDIDRVVLL